MSLFRLSRRALLSLVPALLLALGQGACLIIHDDGAFDDGPPCFADDDVLVCSDRDGDKTPDELEPRRATATSSPTTAPPSTRG